MSTDLFIIFQYSYVHGLGHTYMKSRRVHSAKLYPSESSIKNEKKKCRSSATANALDSAEWSATAGAEPAPRRGPAIIIVII